MLLRCGLGRAALLVPCLAALVTASLDASEEPVCTPAEGSCSVASSGGASASRAHPWPYARGPIGGYGVSNATGPLLARTPPTWTYRVPTDVYNGGLVIDDQHNIYHATVVSGINKLSPDGRLLWTFLNGSHSGAPVLHGDGLFSDSKAGFAFKLNLETGAPVWMTRVAVAIGSDCHSVGVDDGIMVTNGQTEGTSDVAGNAVVVGLSISDGSVLWEFRPTGRLWNFMPMFTGRGTVLFQDSTGGVYHLRLADGSQIWSAGYKDGWKATWTDGMSWLGPNNVFYGVHVDMGPIQGLPELTVPYLPSNLRAYNVSNGDLLWQSDFVHPVNSQPVVAQLQRGASLSVLLCSGQQAGIHTIFFDAFVLPLLTMFLVSMACLRCSGRCRPAAVCKCVRICSGSLLAAIVFFLLFFVPMNFPGYIRALDAETGKTRWEYNFPDWNWGFVRGDLAGYPTRKLSGVQPFCVPNGWGSPSVDATGAIYVGHQNGLIYRIKDDDSDGHISKSEVSAFDMAVCSTHFGAAWAPGLFVWASCDAVFAWKL